MPIWTWVPGRACRPRSVGSWSSFAVTTGCALRLAAAAVTGRGAGPEVMHLSAQRLLLDAELPGRHGDRTEVSITGFTASSLYSGVNPRRVLPIMNILSYEVSTERG